jgi:hypothetical protein
VLIILIQVDSREKARAIKKILAHFDRCKVDYFVSKLVVGDYMLLDNPRLVVDRKQSLSEVYQNFCHDKKRITHEMERAKALGIQLLFLVEHGSNIRSLKDVAGWYNPRLDVTPYAWTGEYLAQQMFRAERMHGVKFHFCDKAQTGAKIIQLLGGTP